MSSAIVRTLTQSHIEAMTATVPVLGTPTPVASLFLDTANKPPDPKDRPKRWFTVSFQEVGEAPITLGAPGDNVKREDGLIVLDVFDHTNQGEQFLRECAEALRTHFDVPVIGNEIDVLNVDPMALGPEDDDGPYKIAQVVVNFQRDRRG